MQVRALVLIGLSIAGCAPFKSTCPDPTWHKLNATQAELNEKSELVEEAYQLHLLKGPLPAAQLEALSAPTGTELRAEYHCYRGVIFCRSGNCKEANKDFDRYNINKKDDLPKHAQCPQTPIYRKPAFWGGMAVLAALGAIGLSVYFGVQYQRTGR